MDVDSGTGPGLLAARVITCCSRDCWRFIGKLIRRIIDQGFWPTAWTVHWLMALHKRNSVSDPHNYRAINLTAQVSKVVERCLCFFFRPVLENVAFGVAQCACREKHGARDARL